MARKDGKAGRYHHGNLRSVLLKLATEHIKSHDVESLSLRKLATQAGVSPTAPYRHFKTRNDLIEALVFESFENFKEQMHQNLKESDSSDPVQYILNIARGYLEFGEENRTSFRLMYDSSDIVKKRMEDDPEFEKEFRMQFLFPAKAVENLISKSQDNPQKTKQLGDSLAVVWGLIHGLTILISDRSLEFAFFEAESKEALFERTLVAFLSKLRGPV